MENSIELDVYPGSCTQNVSTVETPQQSYIKRVVEFVSSSTKTNVVSLLSPKEILTITVKIINLKNIYTFTCELMVSHNAGIQELLYNISSMFVYIYYTYKLTEASIILDILRKPNSIIIILFTWNYSSFIL